MKTRLSKRLNTLFNAIPDGYDTIWDLCCDHGRLGMAVLESGRANEVVFVDQIDTITTDLIDRLQRYGAEHYRVLCQDAAELTLPEQGRHLLVLAGVGDEMTLAIMTALLNKRAAHSRFHWLISPANNVLKVRAQLQQWPLMTEAEGFVTDKGRCYEWLLLTADEARRNPVKNPAPFWDLTRADHKHHLQKLLRHAQQQRHNPLQKQQAEWEIQLLEPLFNAAK